MPEQRRKAIVRKRKAPAAPSSLEAKFRIAWRALGGFINEAPYYNSPYDGLTREFHPKLCDATGKKRDWRIDFANQYFQVAVEIEGGVWTGGRHTRGVGFIGDCEKYNALAAAGWKVFRLTGEMIDEAHLHQIMEAMK